MNSTFLWQRVQLLPRTSSAHEHDYWLVHASGACLASGARSTSVRFDPAVGAGAGALRFTSCARARLDGPCLR